MSEKIHHHSPEQTKSHEAYKEKSESKHLKELHEKARNTREITQDSIDEIKHSIEQTALSGKEYSIAEKESKQPHTPTVTKHIKKDAYKKILKKTQKQLNVSERSFSKVIHQPIVDKVSEVSSKTVARPSGILFGGIGAFCGSLIVFLLSKNSGFTYNYMLFILIFIGGYFIGLFIELIYRLLTIKKY